VRLTFYNYVDEPLQVQRAPSRRGWMDDSSGRYSLRCLPLQIANSYGWQFLCDQGFEATYTGGRGPEALRIRALDPGITPPDYASSHFGDGVLTFHTGYLIRTEAGWDTLATGPTNAHKHGIAPLSGVVETHWLPYPFTFNWRFTRPGTVRFEAGEPIGQVAPVLKHSLEWIQPEIRPLSEDPRLEQEFRDWWERREEYRRGAHGEGEWQRDYLLGRTPTGTEAADHQTKLRLREPAVCPVTGALAQGSVQRSR